MSVAEYVANGAALLDEHKPGWANSIDVDELDMSSCSRCILGQTYGDFADGMIALHGDLGDVEWSFDHGFDDEACHYTELANEWVRAIDVRV